MKRILLLLSIVCILVPFAGFGADRSSKWPAVRSAHLKAHPCCAVCGTRKDVQVHHIKPFHIKPELELDPNNLVTLCTSKYWGFNCHLAVGHGGNFRYENANVIEDIARIRRVGNPAYIREHGRSDLDQELWNIKALVKAGNIALK